MNAYQTQNNTYERMNGTTVKCTPQKATQVYFFTAPANTDHVPNTCTCAYRGRGQKCTHLRELNEFLEWERKPIADENQRKAELGATVGIDAVEAEFLFA